MPSPTFGGSGNGGGSGKGATVTNNYFNMTVNTNATAATVAQDFDLMRSLVGG
jgi:hypothetical protein